MENNNSQDAMLQDVLQYIDHKNTIKLMVKYPSLLKHFKIDIPNEVLEKIVDNNPTDICHIPEKLLNNSLIEKAVKSNWNFLGIVPEHLQTPEIINCALLQNGWAIQYVKNSTQEMWELAIENIDDPIKDGIFRYSDIANTIFYYMTESQAVSNWGQTLMERALRKNINLFDHLYASRKLSFSFILTTAKLGGVQYGLEKRDFINKPSDREWFVLKTIIKLEKSKFPDKLRMIDTIEQFLAEPHQVKNAATN